MTDWRFVRAGEGSARLSVVSWESRVVNRLFDTSSRWYRVRAMHERREQWLGIRHDRDQVLVTIVERGGHRGETSARVLISSSFEARSLDSRETPCSAARKDAGVFRLRFATVSSARQARPRRRERARRRRSGAATKAA